MAPRSFTNAPYRTRPGSRERRSFVKTRCAASRASGPDRSHLTSGYTSHIPTSVRIASYSAAMSPSDAVHIHPSKSSNSAPCSAWRSYQTDLIGSPAISSPPSDLGSAARTGLLRVVQRQGVDGGRHRPLPDRDLELGAHGRQVGAHDRHPDLPEPGA